MLTCCPYCSTDWLADDATVYGLDVHTDREAADRWVTWQACCLDALDHVGSLGFADFYGVELEAAVREITGLDVVTVHEPVGDACVVCRLGTDNPTVAVGPDGKGHQVAASPAGWQANIFSAVAVWHRHHDAPQGWRFGLAVENGGVRVGVATVGNPVARLLAKAQPDMLEITRVAVWGHRELRRNAISKLYAEIARTARLLGYTRLCTYILDSESGDSLRACGFVPVQESTGGDWGRSSRPREGTAPTCPKTRWERGLTNKAKAEVAELHQAYLLRNSQAVLGL